MLYENEDIKLWNPETGELSGKEEIIDSEVTRVIEESYAVAAMKRSSGWEIIENLLKDTCTDLKEKLAYESDLEKFRRLQEAVKAYQNVLTFVDYKIAEGKALEEQQKQSPDEG
jgi:hypothetical protein